MKQPLVKGHPLHAIFSDLPAAGFTLSYVFDILSRTVQGEPGGPSIDQVGGGISHVVSGTTRLRTRFRDAANATYAGAFTGAALAGMFGWWDFLNIPAEHPARKPALIHGLLNSGILVFSAANLVARRQEPRWGGTRNLPFILSSVGFGGLLVSAWIGGDLVYRFGWRVKPAEELEIIEPELSKAGKDDLARDARRQVEEYERTSALIA
jgi:uncharacterized membrane protein